MSNLKIFEVFDVFPSIQFVEGLADGVGMTSILKGLVKLTEGDYRVSNDQYKQFAVDWDSDSATARPELWEGKG